MSVGGASGNDIDEALEDSLEDGVLAHIPDGSRLPDNDWKSRHKGFVVVVLSHIPVLFGLGLMNGTESVTGMALPSIPIGMLALEI